MKSAFFLLQQNGAISLFFLPLWQITNHFLALNVIQGFNQHKLGGILDFYIWNRELVF